MSKEDQRGHYRRFSSKYDYVVLGSRSSM